MTRSARKHMPWKACVNAKPFKGVPTPNLFTSTSLNFCRPIPLVLCRVRWAVLGDTWLRHRKAQIQPKTRLEFRTPAKIPFFPQKQTIKKGSYFWERKQASVKPEGALKPSGLTSLLTCPFRLNIMG